MKDESCVHEEAVMEALRSGRWEDSVREHASACLECRDLVLVSRFMRAVAEAAARPSPLPTPESIWVKARLMQRREAAERALRPLALAERAAFGVAALTLIAGAFWLWPHVQSWLTGWGLLGPQGLSLSGPIPLPASWIFATGVGLLMTSLVVTLYDSWAMD